MDRKPMIYKKERKQDSKKEKMCTERPKGVVNNNWEQL